MGFRAHGNRLRTSLAVLATTYILVSILANAISTGSGWFAPDQAALGRAAVKGIDVNVIVPSVARVHSFTQTFSWWTHSWAGPFRYWRPLTSLAFWVQYRAFGVNHFAAWQVVMILSHLMFVGVFIAFVRIWTGSWPIALLAALLFAGSYSWWPLSNLYAPTPVSDSIAAWKNEPEAWTSTLLLLAVLAAMLGRWRWFVPLAVASICFKELGWFTFPIAALVLISQGRLSTVPRWVIVSSIAAGAVLIALHSLAGWNPYAGWVTGGNHAGLSRLANSVEGGYLDTLLSASAADAILPILVLGICQTRWRPVLCLLAVLGATALCGWLYAAMNHTDLTVALASFLDIYSQGYALGFCAVWVACAWSLMTSPELRRFVPVLLICMLMTAAPIALATVVSVHSLYLTSAFASCLVALGFFAAYIRVITAKGFYRVF